MTNAEGEALFVPVWQEPLRAILSFLAVLFHVFPFQPVPLKALCSPFVSVREQPARHPQGRPFYLLSTGRHDSSMPRLQVRIFMH